MVCLFLEGEKQWGGVGVLKLHTLSSVIFFIAPLLTHCCKEVKLPVDCNHIYKENNNQPSGVYTIYPRGPTSPVQVFQRRMDGSVNFYRPWAEYKRGFGNANSEYWLGLDNIHELTCLENQELMVDMEDFEGNKKFALYSSFKVDNECEGYRMQVSGFNNKGGAGDSLNVHNGQKFSTFDKDQDTWEDNCARKFLGAFWYINCLDANPNGVYRWGADNAVHAVGVEWETWKGNDYSLKSISMKIRPAQ
uniref:Microfibril-associated glycoprotein 4-like n=1 Tax=Cyprinodon variegatus TaxID=28743 RepID=A0A3Q2DP29_CYPVA